MKKNTHPAYQQVLFVDSASGHKFVCGSTLAPSAKMMHEGVEYPVSYLSISSTSHPFFTGSKQLVDSEGRVEKFKKRFDRKPPVVKEASSEEEGSSDQHSKEKEEQPAKDKKHAAPATKAAKTAKKK